MSLGNQPLVSAQSSISCTAEIGPEQILQLALHPRQTDSNMTDLRPKNKLPSVTRNSAQSNNLCGMPVKRAQRGFHHEPLQKHYGSILNI